MVLRKQQKQLMMVLRKHLKSNFLLITINKI